jgi:molybdenum ABC transporter molybdate-binding protein
MRLLVLAATILTATMPAAAQQTVHLHAAGSLRDALGEITQSFERGFSAKVQAKYGPSGLLRDEIAGGAKAEIFASANMHHPQALTKAGKAAPVVLFARNRLCALVRPGLTVEPATLLDHMLDPQIRLGTSTPKADPSGDYALDVFRRANSQRTGATDKLAAKALQLTGGPTSARPPAGRNVYGWHVAEGRADIFLTYCTNALIARRENPGQQIAALPDSLAVGADYGLTVLSGASPKAYEYAFFILSAEGQRILEKHGFAAPALPQ